MRGTTSLVTRKLGVRHVLLAFVLGTLLLPAAAFAQAPGKHPEYLHALADLRQARAYLSKQSPNGAVDADSAQAIKHIDEAISAIKQASIDDGKNVNDHMPVEANLGNTGRFHKATELLEKAHSEVDQAESNAAARGLKSTVLSNIDEAHRYVDHAMSAVH
jgi:hypothetical protein